MTENANPLSMAMLQAKQMSGKGLFLDSICLLEEALCANDTALSESLPERLNDYFSLLGESYSKQSMQFLSNGKIKQAHETLLKAKELCHSSNHHMSAISRAVLFSTVQNNLACLFKATGHPHVAVGCIKKALAAENLANLDTCSTFLNLCAIQSFAGNHRQALQLGNQLLNHNPNISVKSKAICLMNCGVENEFLENFQEAFKFYSLAKNLLEKEISEENWKSVLMTKINSILKEYKKKKFMLNRNIK